LTKTRQHSIYSGASKPQPKRRKVNWRTVGLVVVLVAVALDLVAACSYFADKRFFVVVADNLMKGKSLTGQERLELFVEYAHKQLERPTFAELKPLTRLYYRFNPFHPSARDVVMRGCDYRGGCGSTSRVVMALLEASGIKSRSLVLLDENDNRTHAVVNAFISDNWVVADPLYGLVFTSPSGGLLTAEQLKRDRALFLTNARRNPSYPHTVFTYDNYSLMNWKKIPLILPALRWALVKTIGEERTAAISRPKIWMYPVPAFAILFTVFALIFAGVTRLVDRRSPKAEDDTRSSRRTDPKIMKSV
jgi:hypothetical protein